MIAQWGGVSFPLNPADFTTSFTAGDPIRSLLLGFFRAAIEAELGDVWTAVSATLEAGHALRSTDVIEDVLELPPSHQVMQERKAGFPLLALHRAETRAYKFIGLQRQREQDWHLHFILGPLDIGAARKLLDAGLLVEAVVDSIVKQRRHDAYNGGATPFGDGSPIDKISVTGAEGPGQALYGGDKDNGTVYWSTVITIQTTETGREIASDGSTGDPVLDGASYDVGAGSDEGVLPSVVLADTDSILE